MARKPVHVEIGAIWIDVSMNEQHSSSAEVTEHPVEAGADVADHVREMPDVIQIEGIVSNQPLELPASHTDGAKVDTKGFKIEGEPGLPAVLGVTVPGAAQASSLLGAVGVDITSKKSFNASALRFTQPFDRVGLVHAALLETIKAKKPVKLVTALRTYDQVWLTDLVVNREPNKRELLQFSATLRVLRVVSSETAKVPGKPDALKKRTLPKESAGKVATEPADEASASALAKLAGLTGGFGL